MGVVSITLGGQKYQLTPAYEAMMRIEETCDFTLTELYEVTLAQRLKLHEAAVIVFFGHNQNSINPFDSFDAVGRAIFEERITSQALLQSLTQFLLECLWAPEVAKKKFEIEAVPALQAMAETG